MQDCTANRLDATRGGGDAHCKPVTLSAQQAMTVSGDQATVRIMSTWISNENAFKRVIVRGNRPLASMKTIVGAVGCAQTSSYTDQNGTEVKRMKFMTNPRARSSGRLESQPIRGNNLNFHDVSWCSTYPRCVGLLTELTHTNNHLNTVRQILGPGWLTKDLVWRCPLPLAL